MPVERPRTMSAPAPRCPYCSASGAARCATISSPLHRFVTECSSCGRIIEERQVHTIPFFLLRAVDTPLPLVTPDLPNPKPRPAPEERDKDDDEDPFHPSGFITAFSTWSLERTPVFGRTATSFSGALAELERSLSATSSAHGDDEPLVSVDNLRAYLQILDVSSLLRLDFDIVDHAFEFFKECSSVTCLRNRNVEALATAALVQAIRVAQEPRTLQEISTASNLPQKEIGKYIKILGESLQLCQPLNSNSISVHMPRFCNLLQLNKSAQELAAHIGEVVVNKCFCTRRNPISISAAAIYLACQLEDKRKTQAEICKVTGLTEVTLRKVYKELLDNWNDLLPPDYAPAMPPDKAFPSMNFPSTRASSSSKHDTVDLLGLQRVLDKDKKLETLKASKEPDAPTNPDVSILVDDDKINCSTVASWSNLASPWLQNPLATSSKESKKGINLNTETFAPRNLPDKMEVGRKDPAGVPSAATELTTNNWQMKILSVPGPTNEKK